MGSGDPKYNPLIYTDPSGEFPLLLGVAIGVGSLIGGYIGGSAAEGWEMNPTNWAWDGDTWAGIGIGMVAGGIGGAGFYYAAPALASTLGPSGAGFSTASATTAAYTVTGAATMGASGYAAGFGGGMMYSNGNLAYSHHSGVNGAIVGGTIGSAIGGAVGFYVGYRPQDWIRDYTQSINDVPQTARNGRSSSYSQKNKGGSLRNPRMFHSANETYDYMWTHSHNNAGVYTTETGAWVIDYRGSEAYLVLPNYRNSLSLSVWDYLPVVSNPSDVRFVEYYDEFYRITSYIHTHPNVDYHGIGISDEDVSMAKWIGTNSFVVLWNDIAWEVYQNKNRKKLGGW